MPWLSIAWNGPLRTEELVRTYIRKIGNSRGIVIPKPVLYQLRFDQSTRVDMTIEGDALVLRRPARPVRAGWADAAREIAEAGGDALVMGEFGNAGDAALEW
jgi:antitoxin MazE